MLSLHVCAGKCWERPRRKCGTTKGARQTPTFSLCTQLRQTLWAFPCCIRHISSFWSTSLENQFWEMESLDFVCLGQDGTVWSQWVVEVPPASPPLPPTTPLLIETVKVKTLASAYFPESKHQMLRFGSRMMTVCPKNLPHYVTSVSIMCKLWKTCILCVMWLLSIFF